MLALLALLWPAPQAFAGDWEQATKRGVEARHAGRYDAAEEEFLTAVRVAEATFDATDPRLVESLDHLARLYADQGRYGQAEPLFARALERREAAHGPDDVAVAAGLMNLAWLRDVQHDYAQAEPLYTRALAIREAALGGDHPDVADTLFALADVHAFQRRFDDAVAEYKRALKILVPALGATHLRAVDTVGRLAWVTAVQGNAAASGPLFDRTMELYHATPADPADVVVSLHVLGGLFQERQLFPQAERLYAWALKIMEANLGPDHINLCTGLNNLGGTYYAQGRYEDAAPYYERALTIVEAHYGPEHEATGTALYNLGDLYEAQARFADAEVVYRRALGVREAALGSEHPVVADSLDALATLYVTRGKFADAEPLYQRALAIREAARPSDPVAVATSVNNLGTFYQTLGELDAAQPLYERALALTEQRRGSQDMGVATSLNNLAALAHARNDFETAARLYRRSLAIREAVLGAEHPAVATGLNNLATLLEAQGQYDEADAMYRRALAIQDAALGPAHPGLSTTLNNWARLHQTRGNYAAAEPLFLRAVELSRAGFGERHPAYARFRHNTGVLYGNMQRPHEALDQQVLGLRAVMDMLRDLSLWAHEGRVQNYLGTLEYRFDQFYSLLAQFPTPPEDAARALEAHLAYKGLTVDALARRNRLAVISGDPKLAEIVTDLQNVSGRISTATLAGPGDRDPEAHKRMLAELEQRKDRLEEALARGAGEYDVARRAAHVTVAGVTQALPQSALYLDFVVYTVYNYAEARWTDERRYLAFALIRDAKGQPVVRIQDLGPAQTIDTAVRQLRAALQSPASSVRGIGGVRPAKGAQPQVSVSQRSRVLSELVLQPFAKTLALSDQLQASPDGSLNLVPLEVLMFPGEEVYLCDRMPVVYTLGRDLHAMAGARAAGDSDGRLYVFAAPNFGAKASATPRSGPTIQTAQLARGAVRGWPVTFDALPGTQQEAEAIEAVATSGRVTAYIGEHATESQFKSLRRPAQVHVATHGFFLQDVEPVTADTERGIGGARPATGANLDVATLWGSLELHNPLLRSGLAMAGFNRLAEGGTEANAANDGVLTALEVTTMDLFGTELVVLSACDTGLGEVRRGQGVAGLRRAFRVAGAQHVLMSLWSVPDEETVWLMTEFHRRQLGGESPVDALQEARASVRARLRERDGTDHPHYWAAFVLEGVTPDAAPAAPDHSDRNASTGSSHAARSAG